MEGKSKDVESKQDWYDRYFEVITPRIEAYKKEGIPFEGAEAFWRILALYLSVSAITSIVWAKYFAPEQLDRVLTLNKNVVKWYDGMRQVIPSWYREYKEI